MTALHGRRLVRWAAAGIVAAAMLLAGCEHPPFGRGKTPPSDGQAIRPSSPGSFPNAREVGLEAKTP
jgi:hypothetical protein